jgi:hypothetical protein
MEGLCKKTGSEVSMNIEQEKQKVIKAFNDSQKTKDSLRQIATDYLGFWIIMGEGLLNLKKHIKHGGWEKWVKDNMPFQERQAQRYIRAFTHQKALKRPDKTLSLSAAIDAIKEPKKKPDKPTPEPKKTEKVEAHRVGLKDKAGRVIPDHLIKVFESTDIQGYLKQVRALKSEIQFSKENDPNWRYLNWNNFDVEMKNVICSLKFSIPYAVCRFCGGDGGVEGNCGCCKGAGWINESMYNNTPEDLK